MSAQRQSLDSVPEDCPAPTVQGEEEAGAAGPAVAPERERCCCRGRGHHAPRDGVRCGGRCRSPGKSVPACEWVSDRGPQCPRFPRKPPLASSLAVVISAAVPGAGPGVKAGSAPCWQAGGRGPGTARCGARRQEHVSWSRRLCSRWAAQPPCPHHAGRRFQSGQAGTCAGSGHAERGALLRASVPMLIRPGHHHLSPGST
uniref:Uncharacterized protein n=1 Tax=Pipistrellus kuhlii TaxID=59472 RepID=A0A7J7TPU6_PIPKU|nr:hypothetical protein mPipKuh1_009307 [Pipistrellus kuhlii]